MAYGHYSPPMGGYQPAAVVRLGKTRGPVVIWLLTLITCGLYGLYWYYKVNRELREYNGYIDVSPVMALCNVTIFSAITLGISGVLSFIFTGGRVSKAMAVARVGSCSGLIGILLQAFVFGTGMCYYQSKLNRVWAAHGQV